MADGTSMTVSRVHTGLGVVLANFGEKLAPFVQHLEGLRRQPGCLNEAEQDVAKTQMALVDSVFGQLGDIRASLIAGGPSALPEIPENSGEGC